VSDTGPAILPGIPAYRTTDTALASTLQAIIERLEIREGSRGNPAEKVVTQRDLDAYKASVTTVTTSAGEVNINDLIQKIIVDPTFLAAIPKAESSSGWVNELRAGLEGLRARFAGLTSSVVSGVETLFRQVFFFSTTPLINPRTGVDYGNRWVLKGSTGLATGESTSYQLTVGGLLDVVSKIGYDYTTPASTTLGLGINGNLQVRQADGTYGTMIGAVNQFLFTNGPYGYRYALKGSTPLMTADSGNYTYTLQDFINMAAASDQAIKAPVSGNPTSLSGWIQYHESTLIGHNTTLVNMNNTVSSLNQKVNSLSINGSTNSMGTWIAYHESTLVSHNNTLISLSARLTAHGI